MLCGSVPLQQLLFDCHFDTGLGISCNLPGMAVTTRNSMTRSIQRTCIFPFLGVTQKTAHYPEKYLDFKVEL